jgi:hypothetical protein
MMDNGVSGQRKQRKRRQRMVAAHNEEKDVKEFGGELRRSGEVDTTK